MAIIYTYPTKASPAADDLILISDSADSNKTKQIKVSALPSSGAGITLTTNDTSGVATLTGTVLNIPNYTTTGGTPATPLNSVQFNNASAFGGDANLTFTGTPNPDTLTLAHKLDIKGDGTSNAGKLKLYCQDNTTPHYVELIGPAHSGSPVSYSITLPNKIATQSAVSGGRVLEVDASGVGNWITTPASGGSVSITADNTSTDYVDIQVNPSPITGTGTIMADLNASGTASNTTFLRGDNTWATPTGSGGISFSGTTANGIATYSNSTTANVSSAFTISGNKLSAPVGSLADPSIEVGAIGGLYAASGGIFLAHNGANAIGVASSETVNYKLTRFDAGLKFGSAGGTLNKYEEGTWTPAPWVYSGTAPTVTSANGTYTIIGDICHITFQIVVTGSSSSNAAMILDGVPTVAQGDATTGEQSAGQLFVNTDSNTYNEIPSMFYISGDKLTMVVQGGSKNSLTSPYGLKAQDVVPNWFRPSGGSGITLKGSATYKLL